MILCVLMLSLEGKLMLQKSLQSMKSLSKITPKIPSSIKNFFYLKDEFIYHLLILANGIRTAIIQSEIIVLSLKIKQLGWGIFH